MKGGSARVSFRSLPQETEVNSIPFHWTELSDFKFLFDFGPFNLFFVGDH